MKRERGNIAKASSALSFAFVGLILAQANLAKEFAKLAREHAAIFLCSYKRESTGMNGCPRVIACLQIFYVAAQRFGKRECHPASGLAAHETQFALGKINVAPAKR